MNDIFLSVVLPCRNQEDHIGAVLRQYSEPLETIGRPFELVVVPNACTDQTPAVVAELAVADPCIRVVDNPKGGWGLSVRMGLAAARGEHLCYTNSARTQPQQIVQLLDVYQRNKPCLAKVRRQQRGILSREIGSWLYNVEGRLLFRITSRDVNGTPKIMSKELFERLQLASDGDLLDLELMAKITRIGVPVVETTVTGFTRHGGKSTTKLRSAWRMYAGAFSLWRTLQGFPRS